MEINELLEEGVKILGKREYLNPIPEAVFLLSKLLGVDKTYIYTYGDKEVPEGIKEKFLEKICKRRDGYPLQYILKEVEFMGLKFFIDEKALIPRPDTEILVEYILDIMEEGKKYTVVELGTGSGCISLSLANYCPGDIFIYAVDINDEALKIAGKNLKRMDLEDKVKLIRADLFDGIKTLQLEDKVDIIVSNPPYIPTGDIKKLQKEVQYEPIGALDGGEDGLDFYRKIIPESKRYLKNAGILAVEIGFDQRRDVAYLFNTEGYTNVEIIKDLQNHDRVVAGELPKEAKNAF